MTLDEMEAKLADQAAKDQARDKQFERWNHRAGPVKEHLAQSFFCENSHHSDCRWAECKCACHDSQADWCGWGMC